MRFRRTRLAQPRENEVAAFCVIGRLLARWREDPERLAIAAYAYEELLSYRSATDEMEYAHPDMPMIPTAECYRLRDRALRGRNQRLLRARAEGFVAALYALAPDAEFARLHRVREEVAVIECRELPIEERIAKLRAMEREEARA